MKKQPLTTRVTAGTKTLIANTKKKTGLSVEDITERSLKAHCPELIKKFGE